MIKMIYLCRRLPELTRQEYSRRVLDDHAPLAIRHHPTMQRYVINIAEGTPPGGPEVDSLPALYFESVDDVRERLYDSPEGAEIIRRDVARFLGGADAYATREVVHVDRAPGSKVPPTGERTPGVKWVCPVRRREGMSRDDFARHWREVHAPRVIEALPGLLRYTTNVVSERLSESGEDWDGFSELQFARLDDAPDPDSAAGNLLAESQREFVARALVYPVGEYVRK